VQEGLWRSGKVGPKSKWQHTKFGATTITSHAKRETSLSKYKNNHYVPKWLLKNFRNDKAELFYFSKNFPQKPIEHRNSDSIFSKNYLYVAIDSSGKKDVSLERDHFDALEKEFQPIIQKIISCARSGKTPQLDKSEKASWDDFLANMWSRTPDAQNEVIVKMDLDQEFDLSIRNYESVFGTLSDAKRKELYSLSTKKRIFHNAMVDSFRSPMPKAREALSKRGIGVVRSNNKTSSFLISSFPVAELTFPGRTSLLDPIVELWMPISHDVAVTIWLKAGQEKLVEINQLQIMRINEILYSQSTEIAGKSKELVESFAKRHRKSIKRTQT
jgi:Protein of unknown function (DUF4238)